MTLVWKNFPRGGSDKLAMLALADWCNDEGGSLHPSIAALAKKVNLSDRQTQRTVRRLIEEGWLSVVGNELGGSPGATRKYWLNIKKLSTAQPATGDTGDTRKRPPTGDMYDTRTGDAGVRGDMHDTGDTGDARRVTPVTQTGDTGDARRVTPMSPNPSLEPPKNHQSNHQNSVGADALRLDHKAMFVELWRSWPTGLGEKGSRKRAEDVFLRVKPDRELFATMLRALDAQTRDKANRVTTGAFAAPFQHVERWLRNRRWEDDITPHSAIRDGPGAAKPNLITRIHDRSWAEEIPDATE